MASGFEQFWRSHFGDVPPVGFILRGRLPDRWVRFHALPHSKRYAETEVERRTIIERANILAGDVLGIGATCWLAASFCVERGATWRPQVDLGAGHVLSPAFRWREDGVIEEDDEAYEWCIYSARLNWNGDGFDSLITRIAENEAHGVIWVSVESGAVFAPYDGGFDVIVNRYFPVCALERKYADYLSARSDKL